MSELGPKLAESEFRLFQRFMLEAAGISLGIAKRALVSARLVRRLQACRCASFSAYHALLQRDDAERQRAIDLLTTNETYFFREPKHFEFLREQVLPQWRGPGPFRAWSAASSSGEEAWSLAMLLDEQLGSARWEVLGSDINSEVLTSAERGHYRLARIDGLPRHLLHRYCLKGRGAQSGTFLIGRELRPGVSFRPLNLNAPLPTLPPFDAIFLRNVMIYFSAETKAAVVRRVATALRPGGCLFVGHSESLQGIATGLETLRPSIYRRPF